MLACGLCVQVLVKLLLRSFVEWVHRHPDRPVARFMLQQVGPRTDVRRMNRLERVQAGLGFLLWGVFFTGLWFLPVFVTDPRQIPVDSVIFPLWMFATTILAGMGYVAGIYLLIRSIFSADRRVAAPVSSRPAAGTSTPRRSGGWSPPS